MITSLYSPSTLVDQLNRHGLIVQNIQFNKLVRTKTTDKPNSRNGWYIAYHSPVYMVFFGNWATGLNERFIGLERALSNYEKGLIHQRALQQKERQRQEQVEQWEKNRQKMEKVLRECTPIKGTVAGLYLANRGLGFATNNQYEALLFHPHCEYWEDGKVSYYPCLIAKVTDPEGNLVTLHRTYLTTDGRKAPVKTPKKLMSTCASLNGASIKLGEPRNINQCTEDKTIGIAEGVETALSAGFLFDDVVWAGVSANGVKSFIPPKDVTKVSFYADNDEVGIDSVKEAGERLDRLGIECFYFTTADLEGYEAFKDWNDALMHDIHRNGKEICDSCEREISGEYDEQYH